MKIWMMMSGICFFVLGLALPCAVRAADEAEASDDHGDWSIALYMDNDGGLFKRNHITDRYYTHGTRVTFTHQPEYADYLAETIGKMVPINGDASPKTAMGYALGQEIYTPANIDVSTLIVKDRPYAGWLYGSAYLQRSSDDFVFDQFEIQMGVVGPSSHADDAQKWIHELFDSNEPEGWNNQLPDEFGINAIYRRKWKFSLIGDPDALSVQLIPNVGITLGNVHRNVGGGATLRAGWALPDDFGPGRLNDLVDSTGRGPRNNGIYAFIGASGRYVEHNMFLEGSNYTDSHHVDEKPWVGEMSFGIVANLGPVEFLYSQTHVTEEFKGQDGDHSYGSAMLMYSTAF